MGCQLIVYSIGIMFMERICCIRILHNGEYCFCEDEILFKCRERNRVTFVSFYSIDAHLNSRSGSFDLLKCGPFVKRLTRSNGYCTRLRIWNGAEYVGVETIIAVCCSCTLATVH